MTAYELFINNIKREREEFKANIGVNAYEHWYKIGFYESYYEMFMSNYHEFEDYENIYEWLSTFPHPLQFLYCEWLDCDSAFNHDWDEMWDFVETVYKEEK